MPHALLSVPTCGRDNRTRCNIVMTSIVIEFIGFVEKDFENFADTQIAYARITESVNDGTCGGATPGAEPTPQKRGPLPILSWRRGRLPTLQARVRRPTPLRYYYSFHYKNFLITLWTELRRALKWLTVVVALRAP